MKTSFVMQHQSRSTVPDGETELACVFPRSSSSILASPGPDPSLVLAKLGGPSSGISSGGRGIHGARGFSLESTEHKALLRLHRRSAEQRSICTVKVRYHSPSLSVSYPPTLYSPLADTPAATFPSMYQLPSSPSPSDPFNPRERDADEWANSSLVSRVRLIAENRVAQLRDQAHKELSNLSSAAALSKSLVEQELKIQSTRAALDRGLALEDEPETEDPPADQHDTESHQVEHPGTRRTLAGQHQMEENLIKSLEACGEDFWRFAVVLQTALRELATLGPGR